MWGFDSICDSIAICLADVVELVDTQDLGSYNASCGGSSPFIRTKVSKSRWFGCFFLKEIIVMLPSQNYLTSQIFQ